MAATFVVNTLRPNGDVVGSSRIKAGVITLDAISGSVSGLIGVYHVGVTPKSVATGGFDVNFTNTSVTIGSAASGDDFSIMIWSN